MNIKYKIDTTGAQRKLKKVIRRSETLPWSVVGRMMKASMEKNFDVGGRYSRAGSIKGGSKKWVPRKKKVAWPILNKTGKFKKSLYYRTLKKGVVFGSKGIVYNAAHNYGYAKNNLPARPVVVIQPEDDRKINKLFTNYITNVG